MPKSSIEHISIESPSFLRAIRDAFERIGEHAESLEHIGSTAGDAVADGSVEEDDWVLCLRASKLRGATMHAIFVLQEIAVQTGRLELFAQMRTLGRIGSETASGGEDS